jgi:hypothetical protein
MPNFTITVTAEQTVIQEFEVEAETREEAEEKALAEARDDKYGWDSEHPDFGNHQVTFVEERPEEDEA